MVVGSVTNYRHSNIGCLMLLFLLRGVMPGDMPGILCFRVHVSYPYETASTLKASTFSTWYSQRDFHIEDIQWTFSEWMKSTMHELADTKGVWCRANCLLREMFLTSSPSRTKWFQGVGTSVGVVCQVSTMPSSKESKSAFLRGTTPSPPLLVIRVGLRV